ncbi:MAG: GTP-binding protein [Planctomycetota bacterium]
MTLQSKVPAVVLNGFLGSGKTTLLKSLLVQAHEKGLSIGLVVNDMSELDVDGLLVAQTEFFGEGDRRFQSLSDCVLSSTRGLERLRGALDEILAEEGLDLVIVETSGSCHPMPLIGFFQAEARVELRGVLALVDSAMIDQDYGRGVQLRPIMERNVRAGERDTTNLLVEQVMFCSHLLLSKVDRIEERNVKPIADALHELNPFVSISSVPFGYVPIDDVLAMPEYDYHRVEQLVQELKPVVDTEAHGDRPYNMATRVIEDERPFHPQRLWDTCNHHLGQHIYRSKGFFYLPTRDNASLLWNQAAGGISLELVGYWRAAIVEDESLGLDEHEREGLRERLARETGRFGDRRCKLTVIGDVTQVDPFTDALRRCFLTEDEIEHWQSGGSFPDPWPDNYVTREA